MFLSVVFFWVLSASSYGNPLHQPPVDHGRNFGLSPPSPPFNASVQHPRLQAHRGPGQSQSENFALDSSHPHSHEESHHSPSYDPHHHHDDIHKGHKLKKLEIQKYITQRDLEKHRRNDPTWKTYFAEILAATILLCGIVTFLCWWNWTRRGRRRTSRSAHTHAHSAGTPAALEQRRQQRQQAFQRGQSMPELWNNVNPIVANGQGPKSCLPPDGTKMGKFNKKEILVPAKV